MQQLALILDQINAVEVDTDNMTAVQLQEFRKHLNRLDSAVGAKMGETSTKDHKYADAQVKEYIEGILEDGFNLRPTELSDVPEFVDAQRLRKWSELISCCVEHSSFGAKKFKIHSLRLLRSNIASAKTLHDLRKAINLMISPLQLWRDHVATCEKYSAKNIARNDKEIDQFVDKLLIEIANLKTVCAERKRVLDELVGCYDDGLSDIALLRNCEAAKKANNLSDEEVAKVFGITRIKLNRLRKSVVLVPTNVQEGLPEDYWDSLQRPPLCKDKPTAEKKVISYSVEPLPDVPDDPMSDWKRNFKKPL